jgi:splicing factor 3A subunit 2
LLLTSIDQTKLQIEEPDKNYQYLLFACEPYLNIAFKIPNQEIDKGEGRFFTNWDTENKRFSLQLYFREASHAGGNNHMEPIKRPRYN